MIELCVYSLAMFASFTFTKILRFFVGLKIYLLKKLRKRKLYEFVTCKE